MANLYKRYSQLRRVIKIASIQALGVTVARPFCLYYGCGYIILLRNVISIPVVGKISHESFLVTGKYRRPQESPASFLQKPLRRGIIIKVYEI